MDRRVTSWHRAWIAPIICLAICGTLGPVSSAGAGSKGPPPRFLFAGVPWLVPADSARDSLVTRGYQSIATASDDQHLVLRGKQFDHDALVTGHLDEQLRVVRWVVLIAPKEDAFPYPPMRAVFDEVTRESKARYGPARDVTERYRFPYEKDDGRQDHALRDGLATIRHTWESKSGDRLVIEMNATCAVVLTYECKDWKALEKRRQAKRASDL